MHKPLENTGLLCMMLLAIGLLIGCTSGGKGGTGGTVTIQSSPFPEVADMTSKVNAYLEIAGKTCLLTVDPDTTLSGQCPDIPMTANSYNLKYVHTETGLILAETRGAVNFEDGQDIEISVPSLTKDFDDDGDRYTNIGEMIFETDPESSSSYPFEPPVYYYAGEGPNSLALGDLNGDGVLDVVTANRSSDSVSVLLGKKDGTLQTAKMYTMGSSGIDIHHPEEITMGDMNGDNRLDVVVISSGANSDSPGDLAVFPGNGDGTLQSPLFHAIGNQPISVALGDLDLDGNMDAVTANYSSGDVDVLLGNGDGSLQPPIIYDTNEVSSIALGDLNGDHIPDIIASIFYSQTAVVLLGNGDGTFQSSNTYPIGLINSITLADLNKDNYLDMIVSISNSKTVVVLLGNGDGAFQAGTLYETGNNPGSLSTGDVNGDGLMDIVTDNSGDGVAAVLIGKGDGKFRAATYLEIGNNPSSVDLGDMNGDGNTDVLATDYDSGTVAVLINR